MFSEPRHLSCLCQGQGKTGLRDAVEADDLRREDAGQRDSAKVANLRTKPEFMAGECD